MTKIFVDFLIVGFIYSRSVFIVNQDINRASCIWCHKLTDEESRKLRKRGIIVEEETSKEEEENPFEFEEEIEVNVDEI